MTLLLTGALLVIALLAACVVALLNIAAAADGTPPLFAQSEGDDHARKRAAPQALTRGGGASATRGQTTAASVTPRQSPVRPRPASRIQGFAEKPQESVPETGALSGNQTLSIPCQRYLARAGHARIIAPQLRSPSNVRGDLRVCLKE